jgi:hypothetical protein
MDINNKYGGKLLATGGFGCVFTPALKCIGDKNREKDKISKLMTNKHAIEEYEQLINLNSKLKMIPNYKNFFFIDDFTLCKPSKLTKNDLTNFKECEIFKKNNITSKNINNSLDKLTALNMPYGGITIDNFIMTFKNNQNLIELNNQLLELLKDGIIKMNKKHIYHSDIKPSNILILMQKANNMEVRLIDWSLSVEYIPFKNNPFPKNWKNRPLQFNVPFSIVLFTDMFVDSYSKFLNKKENKPLLSMPGSKRDILFLFVKNYLYLWMKERGYGHYKYINKIMYMLFKYDVVDTDEYVNNTSLKDYKLLKQFIETNYTLPCIINYLVEIIIHFVKLKKDGSLNMRDYLDNIFIQTIDVWGFITSYLPLYELLFENYDKLTKPQILLFIKLKYIFLNYLYEPNIETIKINNLVKHLKEINTLIKNVK